MGAAVAGLGALGVRARSGTGRARRYCPLGKVCRGRGKGGDSAGAGSGGVRATGRGCAGPRRVGGPGARSCYELQPGAARRSPPAHHSPPGVPEPLTGSRAAGAAGPSAGAAASASPRQGGGSWGPLRPPALPALGGGCPPGPPSLRRGGRGWGAANNFPRTPVPGQPSLCPGRGGTPGARGHLGEGPGPAPLPRGLLWGQKVCVE